MKQNNKMEIPNFSLIKLRKITGFLSSEIKTTVKKSYNINNICVLYII